MPLGANHGTASVLPWTWHDSTDAQIRVLDQSMVLLFSHNIRIAWFALLVIFSIAISSIIRKQFLWKEKWGIRLFTVCFYVLISIHKGNCQKSNGVVFNQKIASARWEICTFIREWAKKGIRLLCYLVKYNICSLVLHLSVAY